MNLSRACVLHRRSPLGGTCPSVHVTGTFTSSTTEAGTTVIDDTFDAQTCPYVGTGGIPFSASPGVRGDANASGRST